jgi:hypothetical protein
MAGFEVTIEAVAAKIPLAKPAILLVVEPSIQPVIHWLISCLDTLSGMGRYDFSSSR